MASERATRQALFPDLDFDPEALREKYRAERDRRLRDDGESQYVEAASEFARYAHDDPNVKPGPDREPVNLEIDVAIVGAGFSGLVAGARLKERDIANICLIEAGSDFGGTWYWNRYPGSQCDIESYSYLPLLEETGYMPKEKYSYAPEIFEHCRRVARHYGLYDRVLFRTRVREVRWHEAERRWRVTTNRQDTIRARFVIQATGPSSRPKLPGIPGINDFTGHAFHTARWDYAYTGGDHTGGLTRLADKRVAVIGTGCSAIQVVPFLGEHAQHLYVFQRTPSSVDVRGNLPTDEEWFRRLAPGWQRARRENFAAVMSGQNVKEDLVNDGWTDLARLIRISMANRNPDDRFSREEMELRVEIADFEKMNELRRRVEDTVTDRGTAEALKPWYPRFCKRPTFNDEYLDTFNRDNVELIDVSGSRGVERITGRGVVAGGIEYEADCIVYATGFEITTSAHRRFDFDTIGRDGKSLHAHWADGFRTLHGLSSHGFPNWFTVGMNQNVLSHNMTAVIDDQATHVAYIIAEVRKRGKQVAEVTKRAEDRWVGQVAAVARMTGTTKFLAQCTPGYFNREGKIGDRHLFPYTFGVNAFSMVLRKWREKKDLRGMELR